MVGDFDSMKEFFLWVPLHGSITAIDVSPPLRTSRAYSSQEFTTWAGVEKYFLDLGATQESLNFALKSLNEKGMAKLKF